MALDEVVDTLVSPQGEESHVLPPMAVGDSGSIQGFGEVERSHTKMRLLKQAKVPAWADCAAAFGVGCWSKFPEIPVCLDLGFDQWCPGEDSNLHDR